MPPKERFALIRSQIDAELARRKERDQSWENVVDVCSMPCHSRPYLTASHLEPIPSATRPIHESIVQVHFIHPVVVRFLYRLGRSFSFTRAACVSCASRTRRPYAR